MAVSAILVALVGGLIALQITHPWRPTTPAVQAWPLPAIGTPPPRLRLGVTTQALALNSYRAWSARDLRQVNAFEQGARRHSDYVMWFADWQHVANFDARQAAAVAARGSTPEISWEPWDADAGVDQPDYSLASIIDGAHDDYIRRWAREVAAYGRPLRLRFAHEMNGSWYPWAERANGNRRGEYAAAWHHVHWIFATAGAINVTWVWSPVAGHVDPDLYPGPRQVDALAVSGFISRGGVFSDDWRPFSVAFGSTLTAVHLLDPSKLVALSEIGVAGDAADKAKWIHDMFATIARRPYVRELSWFNLRKEADWTITSSPGARDAFAAGLSAIA